jgi:hypothetical protein
VLCFSLRLDFFLVSRPLWEQGVVQSSEVMGYGKGEREGGRKGKRRRGEEEQ